MPPKHFLDFQWGCNAWCHPKLEEDKAEKHALESMHIKWMKVRKLRSFQNIFRFSMGMQCMMMHVYLPERYRSPFFTQTFFFSGFESLALTASRFYLLEPQLKILATGDDRSFISTCPLSLIQILWKGMMEPPSWFWPLEMINFHINMPPEFDPDSLKRNCGVNFMIWRLLASAYSSRNLLILTTADGRLSISTCHRVWSRFFEKELWSQLHDLTAYRFCILKPQLVDFDHCRW